MRISKTNQFGKPIERTKLYDFDAIVKAKEIIEANPTTHYILSNLADKAGINAFKLKIGFKELYGTSPYKYLLKLRLEKAKLLLDETDLTITEIAYKTGFESREGFTKAFRKKYDQSPRESRKQENTSLDDKEEGWSLMIPKIPPLIRVC